jgi:hypothetical protein
VTIAPLSRQQLVAVGAAVAVALIAVVVATVAVTGDDDGPTTTASTTTSAPTSSGPTSTNPVPPDEIALAVWPDAGGDERYDDPVAVAVAFATDFVGFTGAVGGEFRQGDARSGEVDVRPSADGPVTTVLVRQVTGDDTWWVVGASTASIVLESPEVLASVTSPVALSGRSSAFEATVQVELRVDGRRPAHASGFVMGGGGIELEPFQGSLAFDPPVVGAGALVLFTDSAEDGSIREATVIRIRFGPAVSGQSCSEAPADRPRPDPDETVLTIWFTCGEDGSEVAPVHRVVPSTRAVLRASLEELLAGPTASERAAGYMSWFSPETSDLLDRVEIDDGVAVVDFGDLPSVIPNASTSAGTQMLLSQLDATAFQFSTVRSARYLLGGECEAWSNWLQLDSCETAP